MNHVQSQLHIQALPQGGGWKSKSKWVNTATSWPLAAAGVPDTWHLSSREVTGCSKMGVSQKPGPEAARLQNAPRSWLEPGAGSSSGRCMEEGLVAFRERVGVQTWFRREEKDWIKRKSLWISPCQPPFLHLC